VAAALCGAVGDVLAARIETASLALVELTLAAAAGDPSVSTLQLRLLFVLDQPDPTNLAGLAEKLDLSAPSASRLVDRLVDGGLVARRPAAHSRREVAVRLTAKGRRTLTKIRRGRQARIESVLERMSAAERSALERGLAAFSSAVAEG
jgi:DNA-binding MarR family transcriptional regulator